MLSKACIVGAYQTKLTALAAKPEMELTVIVPPYWHDARGRLALERQHTQGYTLRVAPMRWNGNFHFHYYPTLPQILREYQPDIFHIDEEPYNLATFHAARAMRRRGARAKIIFFTWQNLERRYPPPFAWLEQFMYRAASAAIAGSETAKQVLRQKGFAKSIAVIPQFGVPDIFAPQPRTRATDEFIIGYAGRLALEKGVDVLIRAAARLQGEWRLRITGSGPERANLADMTHALNIAPRVEFSNWADSAAMPRWYNTLDVLVLPSLTRPNWKEQFGRVLTEAMACGVPVIGADSGEIPYVIGDAGIVVPENNADALARALTELLRAPIRREQLARAGRARALEKFSEQKIVDATWAFYQTLL